MPDWIGEFKDRANKALDEEAKKSGKPRGEGFVVTGVKVGKDIPPHSDGVKKNEANKKK